MTWSMAEGHRPATTAIQGRDRVPRDNDGADCGELCGVRSINAVPMPGPTGEAAGGCGRLREVEAEGRGHLARASRAAPESSPSSDARDRVPARNRVPHTQYVNTLRPGTCRSRARSPCPAMFRPRGRCTRRFRRQPAIDAAAPHIKQRARLHRTRQRRWKSRRASRHPCVRCTSDGFSKGDRQIRARARVFKSDGPALSHTRVRPPAADRLCKKVAPASAPRISPRSCTQLGRFFLLQSMIWVVLERNIERYLPFYQICVLTGACGATPQNAPMGLTGGSRCAE